mmetsp:Transcript_20235/g.63599  ORF Transcript_20235/g.63599 Transcript_20235/m.63599 type:complete len:243 (-) Transcript_20235:1442-2170(-)
MARRSRCDLGDRDDGSALPGEPSDRERAGVRPHCLVVPVRVRPGRVRGASVVDARSGGGRGAVAGSLRGIRGLPATVCRGPDRRDPGRMRPATAGREEAPDGGSPRRLDRDVRHRPRDGPDALLWHRRRPQRGLHHISRGDPPLKTPPPRAPLRQVRPVVPSPQRRRSLAQFHRLPPRALSRARRPLPLRRRHRARQDLANRHAMAQVHHPSLLPPPLPPFRLLVLPDSRRLRGQGPQATPS